MIASKLTSNAQTTIPHAVRIALGLQEGDEIAYEIVDRCAVITRASPHPPDADSFGDFQEWHSEADRRAYESL
jgi:antitoxin PrlF